jgi:hypothetical protein
MKKILLSYLFLLAFFSSSKLLAQADFIADTVNGCDNLLVQFSVDSSSYDVSTISSYLWDFGNGQTSTSAIPAPVNYSATDSTVRFSVSLTINGNTTGAISKVNYITVYKTPLAEIVARELNDLNVALSADRQVGFDTRDTYTFRWTIDGTTVSTSNSPSYVHQFDEADDYTVILNIRNSFGCSDSDIETVTVTGDYFFPNILLPNSGDFILYQFDGVTPILFQVFSRSGVKVYESETPSIQWDGTNLSGSKLNAGVYFYTITTNSDDLNFNFSGFVHIFSE